MEIVFPIAAGALLMACSTPAEGEFSRAEKIDAPHSAEWAIEIAVCRKHLKALEARRDRMLVAQTAELQDALMKALQRPEHAGDPFPNGRDRHEDRTDDAVCDRQGRCWPGDRVTNLQERTSSDQGCFFIQASICPISLF